MEADKHTTRWRAYMKDCEALAGFVEPMEVSGRITRVAGLVMECVGLKLAVGSACTVPMPNGSRVEAEVVGFDGDRLFLMPQSDIEGLVPGQRVFPVEPMIPPPGSVTHARRRPSDRARRLKTAAARGQRRVVYNFDIHARRERFIPLARRFYRLPC